VYDDIAYEVYESALANWAGPKGEWVNNRRTNGRLSRWYLSKDDLWDIQQDAVSSIHLMTKWLFTYQEPEFPFGYKILPNCHVLVAYDVRDLDRPDEEEEE